MTLAVLRITSFVILFSAVSVAQTTRLVPTQFPTIQSAIVGSANGDTVLVAPGTYLETISFQGKSITVRSTSGAATTIIDGGQTGTVVSFSSGETSQTILEGFTIQNGLGQNGVLLTGSSSTAAGRAGGIECDGSSPTIKDCIITQNTGGRGGSMINGSSLSAGRAGPGGVRCRVGSPTFFGCTFSQNTGGLPMAATISGSSVVAGSGGVGGMQIDDGVVQLRSCTFNANTGRDGETGGTLPGAGGTGALRVNAATVIIERSNFVANIGGAGGAVTGTATFGATMGSGGTGALSVIGSASIVNCLFAGNVGGNAGAFSAPQPVGVNPGRGGPGAIESIGCFFQCTPTPTISISHATMTGNIGGAASSAGVAGPGAISASFFSAIDIINSIIWPNVGGLAASGGQGPVSIGAINGLFSPTINVTYSDIQGTWPGTQNIDADPLFVSAATGNYGLSAASPCLNRGSVTTTLLPATDKDGEARLIDGICDLGYDEIAATSLAGSSDDFSLETRVNGAGLPLLPTKKVVPNDLLDVTIRSPGGTLSGLLSYLFAQVYFAGISPIGPGTLPTVHLAPTSLLFTIYDGALFPGGLAPAGYTFTVLIPPPALNGFVIRFQGFVIGPGTQNGIFGATDAHDIVL